MKFGWVIVFALLAGCGRQEEVVVPPEPAWTPLTGKWNGVSGGVVEETEESLRLNWGEALTAARWEGEVPDGPFEFECEARRIDGTDFFFSLTFPVRGDENATLVVGGWGGGVVGISSIDGLDASENETTVIRSFEKERWYDLRMTVSGKAIAVFIDGERIIGVPIEGKALSLRPGPIEQCLPFGIGTWQTSGEVRGARWRPLPEAIQP